MIHLRRAYTPAFLCAPELPNKKASVVVGVDAASLATTLAPLVPSPKASDLGLYVGAPAAVTGIAAFLLGLGVPISLLIAAASGGAGYVYLIKNPPSSATVGRDGHGGGGGGGHGGGGGGGHGGGGGGGGHPGPMPHGPGPGPMHPGPGPMHPGPHPGPGPGPHPGPHHGGGGHHWRGRGFFFGDGGGWWGGWWPTTWWGYDVCIEQLPADVRAHIDTAVAAHDSETLSAMSSQAAVQGWVCAARQMAALAAAAGV